MCVNGCVQNMVWHLGGGAAFCYERGTPVQCRAVVLHHGSSDCFRVDCTRPLLQVTFVLKLRLPGAEWADATLLCASFY